MRALGPAGMRLATGTLLALVVAALAAALAPAGWPFELFAHFRWQLAAATFVAASIAAFARRRGLLALAVAAGALQVLTCVRTSTPTPVAAGGCAGAEFGVATLNLRYDNDDVARVVAWLQAQPVDVVVLQEVTPAWARALEAAAPQYPHRRFHPRADPYGIGLLSRWPLAHVATVDFAGDGLPSMVAEVATAGGAVEVIGLHTRWPILPQLQGLRDRGLARAAERARASPRPTVLAGDLNLTPYAPVFGRLERESRLRDAFAGRRWRPTWLAGFWPLALPLDHVLVPGDACVLRAEVGPDVGSDHRPVTVAWRWR